MNINIDFYKIIGFVTLIESNVGHSPKIILNTLKPILCEFCLNMHA